MITTDPSLLRKLRDPNNDSAWSEFVELYQPVIHRLLVHKGLSTPDAEDVAQQILLSISKALAERPHDFERAKFRTWLNRVVRNAALNAMRKTRQDVAAGGTDQVSMLHAIQDDEHDSKLFEAEYEREVFRKATRIVESESDPATWEAFYRTCVQNETIEQVAASLNKQIGSVYAARSRIVKRIKKEVERMMDENSS